MSAAGGVFEQRTRTAAGAPATGEEETSVTAQQQPADPAAQVGRVIKSEAEWRAQLSPEEYHVLREAGTERPFTGEYTDTTTEGVYRCRACSAELFRSDTKFESHCGWPSFFTPLAEERVRYVEDLSMGVRRTEVRCARCDSHLGHVFSGEGYDTPTDLRYCINSVSLTLEPASQA
ncbi:peptide-methionine (R)-S-oxide reductase MsrB [Auraticoccus sp. F435]|uniref:peptide-methionine (R)-S-oxide reductase n=1 Tax=Auraticoccus cholistanensis TaxID=2656650 RepID=A0A6A9UW01_9ACTN|nr:peptide-methionine (R)-S-oxide reductase MsrB [Auraticoccus cholistanensis]